MSADKQRREGEREREREPGLAGRWMFGRSAGLFPDASTAGPAEILPGTGLVPQSYCLNIPGGVVHLTEAIVNIILTSDTL